MKKIIAFSFAVLCYTTTHAQAALLALIFGDKIASEKFHLSVDAGLNIASMPGLEQQKATHGLYFGLGTYIKINDKWALTPEFKPLSPRGARKVLPMTDYSGTLTDVTYDFALKYIDVPLLVQYKITPKLFVSTGPQINFLTAARQVANGKLASSATVDIQEVTTYRFNKVNFAVPVEVGYMLTNARKGKGLDVKLRYNFGLNNMLKDYAYGNSKGSTFQIFLSFPFIAPQEK
jgi:hypothetical protein